MTTNATGERPPAPRGRRAGKSGTRDAILDAARARFARDGYSATTIRRIAAEVGVNPALVIQFFGSKEELFAGVLSISAEALIKLADAYDGPESAIGDRVTRAFLDVWEGPSQDAEPLQAMLRAAISNEQASAHIRDFVQTRLELAISPKLQNRPDAAARAGLASAMLLGIIICRGLVRVPALVEIDREAIVRIVGPAVQAALS